MLFFKAISKAPFIIDERAGYGFALVVSAMRLSIRHVSFSGNIIVSVNMLII